FFFFQAEDGIRDDLVTGVQTCALPISTSKCLAQRAAQSEARLIQLGATCLMQASSFRNYFGSFDAMMSIFSIEGDFARSSSAFSIKACATLPFRCASRPESSANVSKIPYLDGPILIANQDTVFEIGRAHV